ncbi:MAG: nuclear transport factor 2 family protein [Bacteroidales bacterium]|jgi:ketosteroid isomerase-like protein|nr:nuclear transport factor 2 family protein [Bacteroidales bacterium]
MSDYFRSVSLLDKELARKVWSQREDISLINAMGHFFGFKSIFNDFMIKAFSELKSRNLHSASEVVKIYGNFATVELYWLFDIVTSEEQAERRSGRETLFLEKTDNEWQIVHVHYSGMPIN